MEQLVERAGFDTQYGFGFGDQALGGHVDGDLQRRLGSALAAARLQHPQAAILDGEFDVLHVAVMRFQQRKHIGKLGKHHRHRLFHRGGSRTGAFTGGARQILRRADAGNDILALGIDQIFAIGDAFAGGGVAGEGNPRRRSVAAIAEHHRLDRHGGAPAFGDIVQPAIGAGAVRPPRSEHRADGAPQLFVRVLRKIIAPILDDDRLVAFDQSVQVIGRQFGIERDTAVFLGDFQCILEQIMIKTQNDIAVHLDETPIRIPGKTRIARRGGKPGDGGIVQPEVEHSVHHAGHRDPRARSDRNEQRIGCIAEALAGDAFDMGECRQRFCLHSIGQFATGVIERRANRSGNGQARRHRQADARHFGEIGPLAAKQIALRRVTIGTAAAEPENGFGHSMLHFPFPACGRGLVMLRLRKVTLRSSKNRQRCAPHRGTAPAAPADPVAPPDRGH